MTTPANMRWILLDRDTGERNHGIDWRFRVGDQVKIRLVNEMDSDHPMHHPFHVHGAGRFLILSRDGTVEPNLVWKDTVLVRGGNRRHPAGRHESRGMDGALPHRRTPRERHDVQLPRRPRGRFDDRERDTVIRCATRNASLASLPSGPDRKSAGVSTGTGVVGAASRSSILRAGRESGLVIR